MVTDHKITLVDENNVPKGCFDQIAPLLKGYRGGAPLDLDGLDRVMRGLARCLVETPELQEVEVNPLFVYTDRVVAVDARAFLVPPPAAVGSMVTPPFHPHGEVA